MPYGPDLTRLTQPLQDKVSTLTRANPTENLVPDIVTDPISPLLDFF
jgi:hypothetical protein